jgi:MFS superfamily sulfate permease-like transporter/mannitol/fructose-specific phosphotransferase system IIA component (Ntr-type)
MGKEVNRSIGKPKLADGMASVLLLLIGIPLNLGIALASGMSASAGLISGVIGGILVGLLAGCPLMVTAPATGLIAAVVQIIDKHGVENLGPVVMVAGILQILIGRANLAPWFRAVAPAVIKGMLAGIGIMIFASQFHVMLELTPSKSGIVNLLTIPRVVYQGLMGGSETTHLAAILGATTVFVTVLWARLPGRARLIPGSLVGIGVSVAIASIGRFPVQRVSIPDDLASELQLIRPEQISLLLDPSVWSSVIALTLIATAQTLLTATAVDQMHGGETTNYNRETIAQGTGNLVAGILGVLPMAGVMVRSSSNLSAGARTRWSAVLHGCWLMAFAVFLAQQMRILPISSIAGVLVYAGYRLVDQKAVSELSKYSRAEVANYWVTLLAILFTDLLSGILLGFTVSAARLIYVLTHCTTRYREEESGASVVEIQGSATFFTLPALSRALRKVPPKREVHVFVRGLNYIDHACLEHLMVWEERYIRQGGQVFVEWDHLIGRFNQPMTKEIADKSAVQGALMEVGKSPPSDDYDQLVKGCSILDGEDSPHYAELLEQVANVLHQDLPSSGRRNLIRTLTHEFAESGPPVVSYAALPHQLLFGLSQSRLVVVRCRAGARLSWQDPEAPPITCLLFLFSPLSAGARHLRLLSALATRIEETLPEDWLALDSEPAIRSFLLQHQRFVTMTLSAADLTAPLVGKSVAQVGSQLPTSALIVWLDRAGGGIVPKGQTVLQEGDRITILGSSEDIAQLDHAFHPEGHS